MQGGASTGSGPSSFDAYDALLSSLKQKFPSLSTAALVGFSAGGQFMQRYIAYAKLPSRLTTKFFVGSPSSYLYYDTVRPIPQQNGVDVSSTVCTTNDACTFRYITPTGCSGFNDWKYGLDARPASATGNAATLRARYIAADVTYMAGSQDTGSADGSCGANLQGSGRLQRALTYAAYDRKYLATTKNRQVVITNCGHDVVCATKTPAVFQSYLA